MTNNQLKSNEDLLKEIEELKQENKFLKESSKKDFHPEDNEINFQDLVESLPQSVFESDLAGKINFTNHNAFKMFGYSKEDLAGGIYITDLIAPEDMERAILNITNLLKGIKPENNEYVAIKKDGKKFPILVYSNTINENSGPLGIRGIVIDLSDQRKYDDNLQIIGTAIEKVSQPIFLIDSQGTIIYLNEKACKFGVTSVIETRGIKIWEFIPKISKETWNLFWNQLKEKGKIVENSKITTPDGNEHILENHSNHIKVHLTEFCFIYSLDITERVKTEEELRKISKAIEQSSHSVIITDNKGVIEYTNPNFSQVTGYAPKEIKGKILNILKPGYASQKIYDEIWAALNSGNEWKGEFLNKRKNRQYYWESVFITPVRNKKGDVTNFLALKEDINEKKELELELKRALDRAEESSRLKSSLLANMNHEIRTPLTGILGMAQILNEELQDPFLIQFSKNILISGKRLMTTLNAILDLSELESDTTKISISEFFLGSQLKYSLSYFIDLAASKNLYFDFYLNDEGVVANTDQKICNQIVMNLVDNAIKYTNQGGITVSVNPVTEGNSFWLKVSVKDTGIGISEENQSVIFEEFRQISEGINRAFEGNGLGLALVKKMINILDGKIELISKPGFGSEFSVYFPALKTNSSNLIEINDEFNNEDITTGLEILPLVLLVEDNEINTEVVLNFLNKSCITDHAMSGEEALEMAAIKTYQIILMDINLGTGMDGVQASKEIRKIPGYEKTPIVAVTGYAMASEKKKFLAQGLNFHLSKPFSKDELIDLVNNILSN